MTQTFAANPPLKDTLQTALVDVSPGLKQLNFSINDPTRGVVASNSGAHNIVYWEAFNGVVCWTYTESGGRFVGYSVYDPKTGVWNPRVHSGIDSLNNAITRGGTVMFQEAGSPRHLRYAIYDTEINNWVVGSSDLPTQTTTIVDPTGAVNWRTANGLALAIYYPFTRQWLVGDTGALAVSLSWQLDNGTVYYNSSGTLGKLGLGYTAQGNPIFFNGITTPRAYQAPSRTTGNIPLTVFFWDLSIGSTSWSYAFNDGSGQTSSAPNPVYTFNTTINAPFNVVLTASGPGGSNARGVAINPTSPHSIGGTVANAIGFKIPGATVTLAGTINKQTTTDSNGNYSFANLMSNGVYTVTVTKARYTFTPPSRTFTNPSGAQTGNFVGKLNDKPSDFDGDGKTDVSVFRPGTPSAVWWINNSSTNTVSAGSFGASTDKVTPRDFDGDGKTDVAVWRPSEGNWYILQSSNQTVAINTFGADGDIPVANDYDGDDKADRAVFRPSDGNWYILKSSNSQAYQVAWGVGSDKVAIGDYDGDDKGDLAVYRQSEATWYVLRSSDAGNTILQFGATEDKPVQGDYDGDGKTDFATFRPSDATWRIKRSSDGFTVSQAWGLSDDLLAPGDYDGDGKWDVGVFRSSTGVWYALRSSDQTWFAPAFGQTGDYPTPQSYIAE